MAVGLGSHPGLYFMPDLQHEKALRVLMPSETQCQSFTERRECRVIVRLYPAYGNNTSVPATRFPGADT